MTIRIVRLSKTIAISALITAVAVLALPSSVSAWKVNYNANSVCGDNKALINWTFKNQEPDYDKWSIDLKVSDSQTGMSESKTVQPGEEVSGTFSTDETKLDAGQLKFKMTWTDGRGGVDTRTSVYKSTEECLTPEQPDFSAQLTCKVVDGAAAYQLVIDQTAGDTDLTFTPKSGQIMSDGDSVEVVGIDASTNEKVVKTTKAVADCTPEEPKEEKPQVKSTVTELPNTGAGSVAGIMGATFAGGTAVAHLRLRKKN